MGLAKPGKTRRLTGMGQGLACRDVVGRVFGRFLNQTKSYLWSEPGPLPGYPDLLLILLRRKEDFNCVGMRPAVELMWLSRLVPILRTTVTFLGGFCFLHHVDPVQRTI